MVTEHRTLARWSAAGVAVMVVAAGLVAVALWPSGSERPRIGATPSPPGAGDESTWSSGDAALDHTMEAARRTIAALDDSPEETPAAVSPAAEPRTPRLETSGAPADDPDAPRFDVVRVAPDGQAVIAGRAAPGATVTILDGTRPIGHAEADQRGHWVFIPDEPLQPGERHLSLLSRGGRPQGTAMTDGDHRAPGAVSSGLGSAPEVVEGTASPLGTVPSATVAVTEEAAALAPLAASGPAPSAVDGTLAALAIVRDGTALAPAGPAEPSDGITGRRSPTVVIVSIPHRDSGVPVLALEAPRDAEGGSRVLQGPPIPSAGGQLRVGTVDYSASGGVTLSGTAEPGATVHLYLDNRPLAHAEADSGGAWTAAPRGGGIEARLYTLRADQVTADGAVTQRVELPFQRSDLTLRATTEGETMIVVQPGNNLWTVARTVYGQGTAYTTIYRANEAHIRDPNLIYPGQVFIIPRDDESEARRDQSRD